MELKSTLLRRIKPVFTSSRVFQPVEEMFGREACEEEPGSGVERDASLPNVLLGHEGPNGRGDGGGEILDLTMCVS